MRIGINLLYLRPGRVGGTETYAAGLLRGLAGVDRKSEYFVFVNRESAGWPIPAERNFTRVVCPVTASRRAVRYLFEQLRLPRSLKAYGVDVVHSLGYTGPLSPPCPAVVTVPDLNFKAIGDSMPAYLRLLRRSFTTMAVRRSAAVITISDFSRTAICRELRIAVDQLAVTPLGPRPVGDDPGVETAAEIRQRYGIRQPYIAAFGGTAIHKNIPRLLAAFAALDGRIPHHLVLLGVLPADVPRAPLPARVVATGYVPDGHVLPLLSGAEAFVLPSLYEGFGLPVLEAQQAGVPVVCSSAGSLPEVAGDAAVFFDPLSVPDMGAKIARVAGDRDLQETLRRKGQTNVGRFSWERTARETLAVYERVFHTRSST